MMKKAKEWSKLFDKYSPACFPLLIKLIQKEAIKESVECCCKKAEESEKTLMFGNKQIGKFIQKECLVTIESRLLKEVIDYDKGSVVTYQEKDFIIGNNYSGRDKNDKRQCGKLSIIEGDTAILHPYFDEFHEVKVSSLKRVSWSDDFCWVDEDVIV